MYVLVTQCVQLFVSNSLCISLSTSWTVTHRSVRGILQARILEWLAIPFSRYLPDPRTEHKSPVLRGDSSPSEPLPILILSDVADGCFRSCPVWEDVIPFRMGVNPSFAIFTPPFMVPLSSATIRRLPYCSLKP